MTISIDKDQFTLAFLEHLADSGSHQTPKDFLKNVDGVWGKLVMRCDIDKLRGSDKEYVQQFIEEDIDEIIVEAPEEITKKPQNSAPLVVKTPPQEISENDPQEETELSEPYKELRETLYRELNHVPGAVPNEKLAVEIIEREWESGEHQLTMSALAAKMGKRHSGLITKMVNKLAAEGKIKMIPKQAGSGYLLLPAKQFVSEADAKETKAITQNQIIALGHLLETANSGLDPTYADLMDAMNIEYSSAFQYCRELEIKEFIEVLDIDGKRIIKVLKYADGSDFVPLIHRHVNLDELEAIR